MIKTTALWLFCKNLLLACCDIPSHDSVCQHKGVPHAACWKPEMIYICRVSLTTEVTFMKISAYNSCFMWVVCALVFFWVFFFFQYLIRICWFLLGEAEPHRNEEIWGHLELSLFPRARWVPMIKASREGDRRQKTAWPYLSFRSPRALAAAHLVVSQRCGSRKNFKALNGILQWEA